jgi:hypothetical protein
MVESEFSDQLCEKLSWLYAKYLKPDLELLTEATTASCKKFRDFCETMDVRCLPASVGVVALFLDNEIEAGASAAQIQTHVKAISFLHKLNEAFDPTADPLVKAIVRSAN